MGDLPWDDIVVPPDADVEALKKEIGVWCADPFFCALWGRFRRQTFGTFY